MAKQYISPDYLFEVSWEVCNKVGGIHTVISTKAHSLHEELQDRHITIGPDVWREAAENPEFEEDRNLFQAWRQQAQSEGLRVKAGRWRIAGRPIALILDFTTYFSRKDEILAKLWEDYRVDSISGQWDYMEPTLFGYAAGQLIESFARYHLHARTRIVAQFHEWMTGAGLLYLKRHFPQAATSFTTHATVMGRTIAGNQLPLYSKLKNYDGDDKSNDFNVVSKHSLEKTAAREADVFTTVSNITAKECAQFLGREVDVVTPNGFDDSFVPGAGDFEARRKQSRDLLLKVAGRVTGQSMAADTILLATSGRYEFRSKGLDVFTDALGQINRSGKLERDLVAFFLIPAHHYGARKDLAQALSEDTEIPAPETCCLTHHLHSPEHDPVLNSLHKNGLKQPGQNRVKVIFVPCYLNGKDGIFNLSYFDLLIGFDLTVFASYYEPWGYTPMESLAFSIPTVTTTLAGFGLWVKDECPQTGHGISIIERNDDNYQETVEQIGRSILEKVPLSPAQFETARKEAWQISRITLWDQLIDYYLKAYGIALAKARRRTNLFVERERPDFIMDVLDRLRAERPDWKKFMVNESFPPRLQALKELAYNLYWSWNPEAMALFKSIDPELWDASSENPFEFTKRLPLGRMQELEKDRDFMKSLKEVSGHAVAYIDQKKEAVGPKIAYFSMEYGLHDSLKIYGGGLGMLAGDYLKEASDFNRNLVGVGLLYRFGYFTQIVSASGEQIVANEPQDFSQIPARPVRDEHGDWITISIRFPGRPMKARIWKVEVGRIDLYLLDTDFEENMEQDRFVTHYLYGGDEENRLKQEILLGVGGIRALEALCIQPDLYHCNEGHAAFIGLERLRNLIQNDNLTFQEALEVVRVTSLYTTHTPVPAGHDSFEEALVRMYMAHYPDRLKISWDQFIGLGRLHPDDSHEKFSMSYLAINLSQEVNGVSRLHGKVTQHMFSEIWKGYTPDELHIGYVTNGVHLPSWLAPETLALYKEAFGEDFLHHQDDKERWSRIYEMDDARIWSLRNTLRSHLIRHIKDRLRRAMQRKLEDPRVIMEAEESLSDEVLTIGFARRFATYKRAHLLFRDLERLADIVNHPDRPVQFIFAGKAHPKDQAGQELIKTVVENSKRPEFLGKIVFLQNYDIALAKKLVQGVDIWLNTPTRPLEASGTSGQKAVMNGSMHFSVLDGWWAEGFVEEAGWALPEERTYDHQNYQDELDAETIYTMLENEIGPMFYEGRKSGVPVKWISYIKNSIAKVAPNFTMNRMFIDYEERFYKKLHERSRRMMADDLALIKDLTAWKKIILKLWETIEVVSFRHPDVSRDTVYLGEPYEAEVVLELKNMAPSDIGVELVIPDYPSEEGAGTIRRPFKLVSQENGHSTYRVDVTPEMSGIFEYGIRIYPENQDLPHRQDFALVKWV